MNSVKSILDRINESRLLEKVVYTNPRITADTKNTRIVVSYDPRIDPIPVYKHCKDVATRMVQRKNPKLVCTSYDHNIRHFKSGRDGWVFYFSEYE